MNSDEEVSSPTVSPSSRWFKMIILDTHISNDPVAVQKIYDKCILALLKWCIDHPPLQRLHAWTFVSPDREQCRFICDFQFEAPITRTEMNVIFIKADSQETGGCIQTHICETQEAFDAHVLQGKALKDARLNYVREA
jgi:hypothetical protein